MNHVHLIYLSTVLNLLTYESWPQTRKSILKKLPGSLEMFILSFVEENLQLVTAKKLQKIVSLIAAAFCHDHNISS